MGFRIWAQYNTLRRAAYGIALGDEDGTTFTFANFSTGQEQAWDGLVPSFGIDIGYAV